MISAIGVDPGKNGAICHMYGGHADVILFPLSGKEVDLTRVSEWIERVCESGAPHLAAIEKVGAMPKQGVNSMFTFGYHTGALHGILAAFRIPRVVVTPTAWKRSVLAGTKRDKDAAISYVIRKYPRTSLYPSERSRVPNSNMADAVCIAEFAQHLASKQLGGM